MFNFAPQTFFFCLVLLCFFLFQFLESQTYWKLIPLQITIYIFQLLTGREEDKNGLLPTILLKTRLDLGYINGSLINQSLAFQVERFLMTADKVSHPRSWGFLPDNLRNIYQCFIGVLYIQLPLWSSVLHDLHSGDATHSNISHLISLKELWTSWTVYLLEKLKINWKQDTS